VKPIEARQDSAGIHVARGFERLSDEAYQLIGYFHHVTVAIDTFVCHCLNLREVLFVE
jgi:hypothetical protein